MNFVFTLCSTVKEAVIHKVCEIDTITLQAERDLKRLNKKMTRIIKVFTTFSIVIFVAVLLLVYAFMPNPTGILFNENGEIIYAVSRNVFFYTFLGIFFTVQLIFYLFRTYVLIIWLNKKGKHNLTNWFRVMFLLVNLFFILFVSFLGFANNAVDYTYSSIAILAIVGPLLMFVWLLLLPVYYFSNTFKGRFWQVNF